MSEPQSDNNSSNRLRDRLIDWVTKRSQSKQAPWWLAAVSFSEASFFIIPPDALLLPMVVSRKQDWKQIAVLTTVSSVAGGLFGYLIGMVAFDTIGQFIVEAYDLHDHVEYVSGLFVANAFWVVFISAFSPIPYKVFTISSGLFSVGLPIFIVASTLGRLLRFLGVAYLGKRFGSYFVHVLRKYFRIITAVALLAVIVWMLL